MEQTYGTEAVWGSGISCSGLREKKSRGISRTDRVFFQKENEKRGTLLAHGGIA